MPSCQRRSPPPAPASLPPPASCLPAAHPAAEDNLQQQADELQALQAIYGDEFVSALDASSFCFSLPEPQAHPHLVLRVYLPASYPAQHPPICELSCDFLSGDVLSGLAGEVEGMFAPGGCAHGQAAGCQLWAGAEGLASARASASASAIHSLACVCTHPGRHHDAAGEVLLYNWIEHLRERRGSLAPPPAPSTDAQAATAAGAAGDADAALAAELQAAELLQGVGSEGQAQQRQQRGAANQADKALQESLGWQPPELAGMPQSQLQQRLAEDLLQGCPDLDHSVPGVWRQRRLCPLTHAVVPSPRLLKPCDWAAAPGLAARCWAAYCSSQASNFAAWV